MEKELTQKIFFKKYKVKKLICEGRFNSVYEGINILTNEPIAMKFESRKSKFNLLESELFHLIEVKGIGIPKIISSGRNHLFNILIEELLGPSMKQLWNLNKNIKQKALLKTVCMLAIQSLDILQFIHSKNYIHNNIKPGSLLIGNKDKNIIYLVGFGLSSKYRSNRTGKHIKYKFINKVSGSIVFMSLNSNGEYQSSRRDDLESLGYTLIYLAKNYLPWGNTDSLNSDGRTLTQAVYELKKMTTPEKLCEGLPGEFIDYIKYVKKLLFEEDPDYLYMKSFFISFLLRNELKNDLLFFWVVNPENKRKNRINEIEKNSIINSVTNSKNERKMNGDGLKEKKEKITEKRLTISNFSLNIKAKKFVRNNNNNIDTSRKYIKINNSFIHNDNKLLRNKIFMNPRNIIFNTNTNQIKSDSTPNVQNRKSIKKEFNYLKINELNSKRKNHFKSIIKDRENNINLVNEIDNANKKNSYLHYNNSVNYFSNLSYNNYFLNYYITDPNKLKYKKILERCWLNDNPTEINKDKNKLNNRVQFHEYDNKKTSYSNINKNILSYSYDRKNIKSKFIK